jgi:hypothetical protein
LENSPSPSKENSRDTGQVQFAVGGVQQPVPLAPANQAGMAWLRAFDLSLNWAYQIKERFTIEPGVSFLNLMNFSFSTVLRIR